ncbi:hypothetical protein P8452_71954 [Trifolium repens]|nr:hypothetical protein P8452_71954 [Trifolium repens]
MKSSCCMESQTEATLLLDRDVLKWLTGLVKCNIENSCSVYCKTTRNTAFLNARSLTSTDSDHHGSWSRDVHRRFCWRFFLREKTTFLPLLQGKFYYSVAVQGKSFSIFLSFHFSS